MPSAVDILQQLVAIPSVNPMGAGDEESEILLETRLTAWLLDFFRSRSIVAIEQNVAYGRSNVIALVEFDASRPTLLLDAHQDTVPAGRMQDPFTARVEGSRLYGRGACDVKGGMAAMLVAVDRLWRERPADAANVVFSCTCDEEHGANGVRELVTKWSGRRRAKQGDIRRPDACVVAEPTNLDMVISHPGVLRFDIQSAGVACHSSRPYEGRNAIYTMMRVVAKLQEVADRLTQGTSHPLCGPPSLSVGTIAGGHAVNIVPDRCVVSVDRRIAPWEENDQVWRELRTMLQDADTQVDAPFLSVASLETNCKEPVCRALEQVCNSLVPTRGKFIGAHYCSNASTIAATGVPAVVFGPGSIEQAHTEAEYIDLTELEAASEIYYQLMANASSLENTSPPLDPTSETRK